MTGCEIAEAPIPAGGQMLTVKQLQVGQAQLETAISMFFREEDAVSVHTLAHAAHEIFWALVKKRGGKSLVRNNPLVRQEDQKTVADAINEARNFFKHGSKDPNDTLEFNPEATEFILIDAIQLYQQSTKNYTPRMVSFISWFWLKNRQRMTGDSFSQKLLALVDRLNLDPAAKASFLDFESEFSEYLNVKNRRVPVV